jgi:hypothetical protein
MFADVVSTLYLIPLLAVTVVTALAIAIISAPFKLMKKIVNKGE